MVEVMNDDNNVEIRITGSIPKNAIVLEGFQGVGLVGSLAAQYISEKKKAKMIGYISSPSIPAIAVLMNGELKYPMRVYSFKSGTQNFIVFESELPIPAKMVHNMVGKIVEFSKKNKVKEIVCLEGLAVNESPSISRVFGFSTGSGKNKKFSKETELLKNGIVIGVSAALMMEAKITEMPAYCLIAEAHSEFPDGLAASGIIKKLNLIYGLDVNVNDLEKEAKKFEAKLVNVITKANQVTNNSASEAPKKTYIG